MRSSRRLTREPTRGGGTGGRETPEQRSSATFSRKPESVSSSSSMTRRTAVGWSASERS